MSFKKIEILYGIDYKTYACGGIGDAKLAYTGEQRELFCTESDMLERLSALKDKEQYVYDTCDSFELFTTKIYKEEYKLNE